MLPVQFNQISLKSDDRVRDVVERIDRSGRIGLALVVDANGILVNTLSDGDVRRGLLAGLGLDAPVTKLLEIKARTPHPVPVTALLDCPPTSLLRLMVERAVRQVPLLDPEGRVVEISLLQDLLPGPPATLSAVIMAGGRGSRLRPLTDELPKPMLPIDGKPVLEHILEQIRDFGISKVYLTTHYRPDKIVEYFGDGRRMGIRIVYVHEQEPLGTGGALSLLGDVKERLIVMNGDIVTDIDFGAMLSFHQDNGAFMTVAVRRYVASVPYGVMNFDGVSITGVDEKPDFSLFVNAGVYLLEPEVCRQVPAGRHIDMTELINSLVQRGRRVVGFPVREYWLDIGQPKDYAKAQEDRRNLRGVEVEGGGR